MPKKLLFNFNREVIQNYTYVKYVGTIITATNTLEKPIKSAILKGSTKYRDIETGEILEVFEDGRNLELVSVKMPVLTTMGVNIFGGETERGYIDPSTGQNSSAWSDLRSVGYTEVIGGNTIRILVTNEHFSNPKIYEYDENKNFIRRVENNILSPHAKFVRFCIGGNTNVGGVSQVMLYYGDDIKREYEPHKTNILSASEDVILRRVGNVQDELNLLTGEVVQRIGEIVLDGSENWELGTAKENTQVFFYKSKISIKNYNAAICDKFSFNVAEDDAEKIVIDKIGQIYIAIKKTTSDSVSKFKTWLSNNNIFIQYQLAAESIKTVDLSILDQNGNKVSSISSFNDTTHITASSETIPPIFEGYLATKEFE